LANVNSTMEYRTRTIFWSSLGYTSASTYRTSTGVLCTFNKFVLRDPLTVHSAIVVQWLGDLDSTEDAVQGEFRPLASDRPVIVSDAILGQRWRAEIVVADTEVEDYLKVLRNSQTPLVLQTDMSSRWYWVRIGSQISKKVYRQTNRVAAATRSQLWTFDLVEVQPAPGQPRVFD
jgi:hypothetical protein